MTVDGCRLLQQVVQLDPDARRVGGDYPSAEVHGRAHWTYRATGSSAGVCRQPNTQSHLTQAREAHVALAQIRYWFDWDWGRGRREYETARALILPIRMLCRVPAVSLQFAAP